jgi:RES domain-containing protein
MRVWRICSRRFAEQPLDGEGARLFGGRWNSVGVPMVYTSAHISLAILELLVHVDTDLVPDDWVLIEVMIPDSAVIQNVAAAKLPPDWRAFPVPDRVQALGDTWVQAGTALALCVPSVIVPEQSNVLLNNHFNWS